MVAIILGPITRIKIRIIIKTPTTIKTTRTTITRKTRAIIMTTAAPIKMALAIRTMLEEQVEVISRWTLSVEGCGFCPI